MNLMDLFIKIGVDDQASGSINKLTSMSIAKGHLIADAVKKALSIMVDLGKQSIMTYADFEQLEGGIKKLFGEQDMKKVLANADMAYKTAGMSANKYLETTTSFAASLIAGLDGDTAKAAEYADMAIRDMSDNANTFGTDISMIQNAYQGFAKQNYTMLDNLRLGYGGTASEMARLINDSGVLGDTVTVTASNINRVSFDTIVKAINKVQEEMGITGTTMTEAEGTIKGSLEAVKASWENLLVAMINDPDSVGEKFDQFAENAKIAWGNISPAIDAVLQSIKNLVLDKDGISNLLDTGFNITTEILNGMLGALTDGRAIQKISEFIAKTSEKLSAPDGLKTIWGTSLEIVLALVDGLLDPNTLKNLGSAATGVIGAFLNFVFDSFPSVVDAAQQIIDKLGGALESISEDDLSGKIASGGEAIINKLKEAMTSTDWDALGESLLKLLRNGIKVSLDVVEGLSSLGEDIFDKIGEGFKNGDVKEWLDWLWEKLVDSWMNSSLPGIIYAEATGKETTLNKLFGGDVLNKLGDAGYELIDSSGLLGPIIAEITGKKDSWLHRLFGSHKNGLEYVPYDGYLAELHKGERVLTASEARDYHSDLSGSTINIVINGAQYDSEESLAEAVANRLQQMIDGKEAAYD